jgi:hypothetical protein
MGAQTPTTYDDINNPRAAAVADVAALTSAQLASELAGYLYYQNVAAAAADNAGDQLDIEAAAGGETVANLVQPDVPRNLKITVTDSGVEVSAFQIDVVGTAPDGTAATEQFVFAGGLVQEGSVIFAKLTSVTLTSITETGATAKTLDVGWQNKLGIPVPAGSSGLTIVKLVSDGAEEAAAATDADENSFTPTTVPGVGTALAGQPAADYMYLQNVAVAAADDAGDQLNIEGASGGETVANLVQPDVPRNLKITVTDGGVEVSAFQIDVVGTAPDGSAATEQFLFAGGLVQEGSVVFAKLTSVTLTSITETGATAKTLDVGWQNKLGVPVPAGSTGLSIVKLVSNGTEEAASATDTTENSFTPTTAPDGVKDYEVWFEYTDETVATVRDYEVWYNYSSPLIAAYNALQVDVAALRTKQVALMAALRAAVPTPLLRT